MKPLSILFFTASLSAFASLSPGDQALLKEMGVYYERTSVAPTTDPWLKTACPPLIGIVVEPEGAKVFSFTEVGKGASSLGLDPEINYSHHVWNFTRLNEPAHKFTSWHQLSDGLSMPLPDPYFRGQTVQILNRFDASGPNLVQEIRLTPFKYAFFLGKPRVIVSEVRTTKEGVELKRLINGKVIRLCGYTIKP